MVGVPRSKGCLTCRRRKVACDQTKPSCHNCLKRGVNCEGYARYPTILQYTGSGLKKRDRFEEVAASDSSALVLGRNSAAAQSASIGVLPTQPTVGRFILDQVGMSCLDSYLPTVGSEGAIQELKRNWMWMILDLPNRGQSLESSFAALCFSRVGIIGNDEGVLAKGRKQYAIGLNALQHALKKPDLAFQASTLAAIRTLSIYELWSMPWLGMSKAHVHEEGMTQWCLAAGPQNINTEFALQVFHDVRWCIMNRAIESHQRSSLDTADWRTLPWRYFAKDSLQCLFDLGFDLAVLLEELDLCDSPLPPEISVSKRAQLSLKCSGVESSLDDWYRLHWSHRDSPAPFSVATAGSMSSASSPGADRPEFESLWEATNIAYYWLFRMILDDILASTTAEEDQEDLMFSSLDLAVKILSASPFFLADATGWLGPQRLFFPLRKAMVLLVAQNSPFAEDAQQTFMRTVKKLRS